MKHLVTASLILGATQAVAHPGHDAALGQGAAHWLMSPLHGVGVIVLAAALFALRSRRQKE